MSKARKSSLTSGGPIVVTAFRALMSAAGGYVFAEFRQQQAIEDARAMHEELRGMRDEINAQLQALKQTAERLARERGASDELPADAEAMVLASGPVDRACNETGSDPDACVAVSAPAAEIPVGAPVASDRAP